MKRNKRVILTEFADEDSEGNKGRIKRIMEEVVEKYLEEYCDKDGFPIDDVLTVNERK